MRNRSSQEVVVLGYDGEPYLKLNTAGTFINLNSPATYTNKRTDANVPIPKEVTSTDTPNWYQLSFGDTVWWHDHRAHWMGTKPPDVVQAAPDRRHVVYDPWTIPLLVDGKQVSLNGQLTWVPTEAQGPSDNEVVVEVSDGVGAVRQTIAVHVDETVEVPREYVKNNEIVLNVGFEATSGLKLGNDFIEFKARFGGVAREILVPVDHVVAIYARENGQGMAF